MKSRARPRLGAGIAGFCLLASTTPALATEGYVPLGYGTIQRSQGGAGVAMSGQDAMAMAINPAAIAGMGGGLSFGLEAFMPHRGYDASGTGFVAPGSISSARDFFLVPNFGWVKPLANGGTLGVTVYGNGGMNTSYQNEANTSPGCGMMMGSGVFCAGSAGVDLAQVFVSVGYAQESSGIRWGVAPTLAIQGFKAYGLDAFSGLSVDPANMTGTGRDWSYGVGLRLGAQVDAAPGLTLGIAAQTKINMTEFDNYAGLFEGGGDFDIPAQVTLGMAWQASDAVTVMADYQRIFYSGVPAVSNAFGSGPLGAPGGSGFGWDDVDVLKLGIEWRQNDKMTWRAGYAHATNPIGAEDVTLGILAPGVVENHFSVGGSYRPNERDSFDFALVYVPEVRVSGPEVTPMGMTPGSSVELWMDQVEVSFGWTRRF